MSNAMLFEILQSTWQTIYMVVVSGAIATIFGIPLGVILLITRRNHIYAQPYVNRFITVIVNTIRSIPFIILLIAITPLTRLIAGTSIGTTAAIVPLSLAAIPFVGRLVESALHEVPAGLIETGIAMGASPLQIIIKIIIPEALSGIINTITITMVALIGYSAMAGAIGGGGLGDLAISYGVERFEFSIMLITIIILILLVQGIQNLGDFAARKVNHR